MTLTKTFVTIGLMRMLLLVITSGFICGQTMTPAFEVASVRPRTNAEHGPLTYDCAPNGRFTNAGPLRAVILWAYDINPYQLVGMPSWDPTVMYDNSGLYTIEAKAAGPVSEATCKLMVQNLLAKRFEFASHWEDRAMRVYELVVGKSGPKLRNASPSSGQNRIVIGGRPMQSLGPQSMGWSMNRLAQFLSSRDRPVLDRTGLDGLFWIDLDFTPDGIADPGPDAGPDLRTAVQKMGLRLNPITASVRILVIDRMEKPDAN